MWPGLTRTAPQTASAITARNGGRQCVLKRAEAYPLRTRPAEEDPAALRLALGHKLADALAQLRLLGKFLGKFLGKLRLLE